MPTHQDPQTRTCGGWTHSSGSVGKRAKRAGVDFRFGLTVAGFLLEADGNRCTGATVVDASNRFNPLLAPVSDARAGDF